MKDPPYVRITRSPTFQVGGYLVDVLEEMQRQSNRVRAVE